MRKAKLIPTILCCLLWHATAIMAADNVMVIHPFNDDSPQEISLGEISKITFEDNGFSVINPQNAATKFAFSDVKAIKFSLGDAGVQAVPVTTEVLKITPNPVVDVLHVSGYEDGIATPLNIYSISGAKVKSISNWTGEDVNVGNLSKGVYFLSINSKTIKFIKL